MKKDLIFEHNLKLAKEMIKKAIISQQKIFITGDSDFTRYLAAQIIKMVFLEKTLNESSKINPDIETLINFMCHKNVSKILTKNLVDLKLFSLDEYAEIANYNCDSNCILAQCLLSLCNKGDCLVVVSETDESLSHFYLLELANVLHVDSIILTNSIEKHYVTMANLILECKNSFKNDLDRLFLFKDDLSN